jgi:hypothetical protein
VAQGPARCETLGFLCSLASSLGESHERRAKGLTQMRSLTKANKSSGMPKGGALEKLVQISINIFVPARSLGLIFRSDLSKSHVSPGVARGNLPRFSNVP